MAKLHEKRAGADFYSEDYNESLSFVFESMLRYGMETGSTTSQQDAYFNQFPTDTAGSTSNMTYGAGSYTCNNAAPLVCSIRTAAIPVNYSTAGSGRVSHWAFDLYSLGSDVIGTNHGSPVNITQGNGKIEKAYIFNNSTAYVHVPYAANIGTGSFTVSAWVYPTSRPAGTDPDFVDTIISTDGGADITGGWQLSIKATGSLNLLINDGTKRDVDSLLNVPLNTWSYVTYTFDGANMKGYVNGSSGNGSFTSGAFTRNGSPIQIGRRTNDASYGYYFGGSMDEVSYWNRALTLTEIQYIYNNGRGTHYADFNGSVTSAIAVWQGSFSSTTVITSQISLDNGTTFTNTGSNQLGSATPSTGSLISKLIITRAATTVRDTITAVGIYYG